MKIVIAGLFLLWSWVGLAAGTPVNCYPVPSDILPAVQKALRSTVTIISVQVIVSPLGRTVLYEVGSGFVLDERLRILGSGHVAKPEDVEHGTTEFIPFEEAPKSFFMVTADCGVYPITLISYGDPALGQPDVAYWQFVSDMPIDLPVMPRAAARSAKGDWVASLGSPQGHTNRAYYGEVTGVEETPEVVYISGYMMEGMSGGGVINQQGEVVGILRGFFGGLDKRVVAGDKITFVPLLFALEFLGLE